MPLFPAVHAGKRAKSVRHGVHAYLQRLMHRLADPGTWCECPTVRGASLSRVAPCVYLRRSFRCCACGGVKAAWKPSCWYMPRNRHNFCASKLHTCPHSCTAEQRFLEQPLSVWKSSMTCGQSIVGAGRHVRSRVAWRAGTRRDGPPPRSRPLPGPPLTTAPAGGAVVKGRPRGGSKHSPTRSGRSCALSCWPRRTTWAAGRAAPAGLPRPTPRGRPAAAAPRTRPVPG